MPVYEYNCEECGNRFEALIRSKSDLPTKCPKCGGKIRKGFSSFAVSAASGHHHDHESFCSSCPSSDSGTCQSGTCPMAGM